METTETNLLGSIHMTQRVISIIASQTAASVPEVAALDATIAETAARKVGRVNPAQGVDTTIDGIYADIAVRLLVRYNCRIPDMALAVQKKVKDAVEAMTGCRVHAVHVMVQDIVFPEKSTEGIRHD